MKKPKIHMHFIVYSSSMKYTLHNLDRVLHPHLDDNTKIMLEFI